MGKAIIKVEKFFNWLVGLRLYINIIKAFAAHGVVVQWKISSLKTIS